MDIKLEIKEEVLDEEDVWLENGASHAIKLERDDKPNSGFQPRVINHTLSQQIQTAHQWSATLCLKLPRAKQRSKYTTKQPSLGKTINQQSLRKPTNVECDSMYFDGEPAISISTLTPSFKKEENAPDPLAISPPKDAPQKWLPDSSAPQYMSESCHFPNIHVPSVQSLVNKTYSSQHRMAHRALGRVFSICSKCETTFSNQAQFQQHREICQLKCPHCNLFFSKTDQIAMHKKNCALKINKTDEHLKPERRKRTKNKLAKWACNICYTENSSNEELRKHKQQFHTVLNAYACHLCDEKFSNQKDARRHLKKVHECS